MNDILTKDGFPLYKNIKGLEQLYQVSVYGDIISLPRDINTPYGIQTTNLKQYKGVINKKGYKMFDIRLQGRKGKRINKPFHRIVAETFIDNPQGKPHINHIDGNKLNNRVDNLEWVTNKENMQHAYKIGLQVNDYGVKARNHKYTYYCNDLFEIKGMTALEIAKYLESELNIKNNNNSTASNIRTRGKVFGYTFIEEKGGGAK